MIKHLLIPLENSSSSAHALKIACSFAALTKAKLTGLFIEDERWFYELPLTTAIAENITGNPMVGAPLPPDRILEVEERVEQQARDLFQLFEGVCKEQQVVGQFLTFRGEPLSILVERAKSVDLVVLGNPSIEEAGSYRDFIPGLFRETTRPVLVVGEASGDKSIMVVAYDGSKAAERALSIAAEFGEINGVEHVHLLTVSNDPESAREIQRPANEYLSSYRFEVVDMWIAGKPAEAIKGYAASLGAGVVVMGAFGSNRLAELIFGSTTEQLLKERKLALLVVP